MIKTFFKDLAIQLYKTLTVPDPCKRCLVRACCSEKCDTRDRYETLNGDSPFIQKFCALTIILGVIMLMFSISKLFTAPW